MFERFTRPARDVVRAAVGEAERLGHPSIGPEHLLLALASAGGDGDDLGGRVLRELGVTHQAVDRELAAMLARGGLSEDDARALRTLGIDLDEVRRQVEAAFGPGALQRERPRARRFGRLRRRCPEPGHQGHRPFSAAAKKVLELSLREALALGHNHIGTEHVLLALVRSPGDRGTALLQALGVRREVVRSRVIGALRRAS
jgi:ATP-dependent Clp protease ATP-binding subunit ClpA